MTVGLPLHRGTKCEALLDVRSVRYPVTHILEKRQEFPRLLKCYYVAVIDSEDVRSSSMSRTVGFLLQ